MRSVFCFAAVLALAGCESDGKPSQYVGAALKGFSRGFGDGTVETDPPVRSTQPKLQAVPAPATQPISQQAVFTGKSQQVQTVTGGLAWKCEYHYGGQDFVLMFENYCPPSASVR